MRVEDDEDSGFGAGDFVLRISDSGLMIEGFGGLGVEGFALRVEAFRDLGRRVGDSWYRFEASRIHGFKVQGFRIQGVSVLWHPLSGASTGNILLYFGLCADDPCFAEMPV